MAFTYHYHVHLYRIQLVPFEHLVFEEHTAIKQYIYVKTFKLSNITYITKTKLKKVKIK